MNADADLAEPVSPRSAVVGAFLALAVHVAFTLFVYVRGIELPEAAIVLSNLLVVVLAVVYTQLSIQRQTRRTAGYRKLWLYGWMSGLLFGLGTAVFYKIFFAQTGQSGNVSGYFGMMLVFYNFLGLVISAIVGFFISKM